MFTVLLVLVILTGSFGGVFPFSSLMMASITTGLALRNVTRLLLYFINTLIY